MLEMYEVIFEVYIEDKLTNKQQMKAPKEILIGRKKYRLRGKKEKKFAKKIIHNQSIKKKMTPFRWFIIKIQKHD